MQYWPEALAVTARFAFWYFLLPFLLLPRRIPAADRAALGFGLGAAAAVVLGHLLAAARLYEPLSLWAILLLGLTFRVTGGLSPATWLGRQWLRLIFRLEEQDGAAGRLLRTGLGRLGAWAGARLGGLGRGPWPVWAVGAAVLGWAAWLRYHPSLRHAYLGVADGYVHLAWVKYLEGHGGGGLYRDGVYPYGYHAILSLLGTLNFVDRLLILRFAGPIAGMLLVLSVGYAAHRLRLGAGGVLAGMALLGLGFGAPLPDTPLRHTQPLPQEFAAIFVLPGAAWAWSYLRAADRWAAAGALVAAFLTASIHPYALLCLVLALAAAGLAAAVTGSAPFRRVVRLGALAAGAAFLGMLPMLIGRLLGIPWHAPSIRFVVEKAARPEPAAGLARIVSGNILVDAALGLAAALVLGGLVAAVRGSRERGPVALALGVVLGFLFTQVHGRTGVPVLMDPARSGLFFTLFLALAAGVALDAVLGTLRVPAGGQALVAGGLAAALAAVWWPSPPVPQQFEYDEAVATYLAVSRRLTRHTWTIVAPVEQYSQVLGAGLHQDLGEFLARVGVADVRRPDFRLPIPTPDVFVFVEKWPLGSPAPVTPDPDVPLTAAELTGTAETKYHNPEVRARLEQRAWAVMEAYREAHPDQVRIYLDTPRFRVYHIRHRPAPQEAGTAP